VENKILRDAEGKEVPARLWTSTMRRTKETTQFIQPRKIVMKPDPADPSQDYEWVQMRPRAWHHLDELPGRDRAPGAHHHRDGEAPGASAHRRAPGHPAHHIYAFYMGLSRAEAPYVTIKLNCVMERTRWSTAAQRRYALICKL
jgi:hypothetical protein